MCIRDRLKREGKLRMVVLNLRDQDTSLQPFAMYHIIPWNMEHLEPVSYTHLTLPTICSV
eukprot:11627758-Prorocentrum_lima.AAC.1